MADQRNPSIFPDIPRESPETDKDGRFTSLWSLGFGALFQALQDNFNAEGISFPPLASDDVATIQGLYTPFIGLPYNDLAVAQPDISGHTIYNSTTKMTNQFVIATDTSPSKIVQVAQWVPLSVLLTSPVNPNYNESPPNPPPARPGVAGVVNWLCYDIEDKQLWICTASGAKETAVWTLII